MVPWVDIIHIDDFIHANTLFYRSTSPQALRSLLGGALQLPDGNIFCAGGKLEVIHDSFL